MYPPPAPPLQPTLFSTSQTKQPEGDGSTLEVCGHWSHGELPTNALQQATLDCSTIAHDSLGALNIRELSTFNALDFDLAQPVLPRHPRFTMRDLGPVFVDTITNHMAYGLGFLWRRGAGGE